MCSECESSKELPWCCPAREDERKGGEGVGAHVQPGQTHWDDPCEFTQSKYVCTHNKDGTGSLQTYSCSTGTSLVLCMSRLFVVTLYLIFCTKHSRPYLYSGCGLRGLIWMVTLLREERPVNREPSRLQEKAQFWHNYFLANQGTCRLINFVYCDGVYKYK